MLHTCSTCVTDGYQTRVEFDTDTDTDTRNIKSMCDTHVLKYIYRNHKHRYKNHTCRSARDRSITRSLQIRVSTKFPILTLDFFVLFSTGRCDGYRTIMIDSDTIPTNENQGRCVRFRHSVRRKNR